MSVTAAVRVVAPLPVIINGKLQPVAVVRAGRFLMYSVNEQPERADEDDRHAVGEDQLEQPHANGATGRPRRA